MPKPPPKPPAFTLLEAFGSKTWFRDAFNWERDEIYAWMEKASKGEAGGEATKDKAVQAMLAETLKYLKLVALPSGGDYLAPEPKSHIYRKLNPKFKPPKPIGAKFDLRLWTLQFRGEGASMRSNTWWSPYDLLGQFLSLLGPAPQTADRNTFFLPLTAVYARWCTCIAGRKPDDFAWEEATKNGAGQWPFMFQCTWRSDGHKTKPKKWFFLGASTGGDEFDRVEVGPWKNKVLRQRFSMMIDGLRMKLLESNAFQNRTAPEQNGGSNATWGNCAETYPFVFSVLAELFGLALSRNFMRSRKPTAYDHYRGKGTWSFVIAPCGNCTALLTTAGATLGNFTREFEADQAPEKPKTVSESVQTTISSAVKEAASTARETASKLVSGGAKQQQTPPPPTKSASGKRVAGKT